jgi:malonate decarboxylase epsilon subunit
LVICGMNSALQKVMQQALQSGASKAVQLAVKVPSHCPLFADAVQQMQNAMDQVVLHRPTLTYLSANAARALYDPNLISIDLASNMARQVHWSETSRLAWERGARLALEMPGGTVLSDLVGAQWSDGMALSCDTSRLDTLIALARRSC